MGVIPLYIYKVVQKPSGYSVGPPTLSLYIQLTDFDLSLIGSVSWWQGCENLATAFFYIETYIYQLESLTFLYIFVIFEVRLFIHPY